VYFPPAVTKLCSGGKLFLARLTVTQIFINSSFLKSRVAGSAFCLTFTMHKVCRSSADDVFGCSPVCLCVSGGTGVPGVDHRHSPCTSMDTVRRDIVSVCVSGVTGVPGVDHRHSPCTSMDTVRRDIVSVCVCVRCYRCTWRGPPSQSLYLDGHCKT